VPIYALGGSEPDIHPDAYVHPDAVVIGNVTIGAQASVWPTAVLRGDDGRIEVGRAHVDPGRLDRPLHALAAGRSSARR
jgi:carbonic anhydrase/acetyltransferase-like protein (isoleucine patch superfamily)